MASKAASSSTYSNVEPGKKKASFASIAAAAASSSSSSSSSACFVSFASSAADSYSEVEYGKKKTSFASASAASAASAASYSDVEPGKKKIFSSSSSSSAYNAHHEPIDLRSKTPEFLASQYDLESQNPDFLVQLELTKDEFRKVLQDLFESSVRKVKYLINKSDQFYPDDKKEAFHALYRHNIDLQKVYFVDHVGPEWNYVKNLYKFDEDFTYYFGPYSMLRDVISEKYFSLDDLMDASADKIAASANRDEILYCYSFAEKLSQEFYSIDKNKKLLVFTFGWMCLRVLDWLTGKIYTLQKSDVYAKQRSIVDQIGKQASQVAKDALEKRAYSNMLVTQRDTANKQIADSLAYANQMQQTLGEMYKHQEIAENIFAEVRQTYREYNPKYVSAYTNLQQILQNIPMQYVVVRDSKLYADQMKLDLQGKFDIGIAVSNEIATKLEETARNLCTQFVKEKEILTNMKK